LAKPQVRDEHKQEGKLLQDGLFAAKYESLLFGGVKGRLNCSKVEY
jgi:hypothetical protein